MFTINIGGVLVMHKKGKRSNKCEMSKMSIHTHTTHCMSIISHTYKQLHSNCTLAKLSMHTPHAIALHVVFLITANVIM